MTSLWLLPVALAVGLVLDPAALAAEDADPDEAASRQISGNVELRLLAAELRRTERLRALRAEPVGPADRPSAAPGATYSAAGLQRWISDSGQGGDPTASPAGHWIDPTCTGYGPGLGPRYVLLPASDSIMAAVAGGLWVDPSRPPSTPGSTSPGSSE